jgi:hypothetical protein
MDNCYYYLPLSLLVNTIIRNQTYKLYLESEIKLILGECNTLITLKKTKLAAKLGVVNDSLLKIDVYFLAIH